MHKYDPPAYLKPYRTKSRKMQVVRQKKLRPKNRVRVNGVIHLLLWVRRNTQMDPNGTQMDPNGTQMDPNGNQMDPNGPKWKSNGPKWNLILHNH